MTVTRMFMMYTKSNASAKRIEEVLKAQEDITVKEKSDSFMANYWNDMDYDYKFFEFLGIRINSNNEKLQELLKDEKVRKFINILEENKRLSLGIKEGMEECSHVFVMTDVCEEGNVVYHCLKCGLTNEYGVKKQDKVLTEYEMQMSDIFKRTFVW